MYLGWVWNGKDTAKSIGTAVVCRAAQWCSLTKEVWDTPSVSIVLVATWHQKGQKMVYSPLPALFLFCGLQVSEWCISRIVFWERNPLHLLSCGDFTQTDIKTWNVCYFEYEKSKENISWQSITYLLHFTKEELCLPPSISPLELTVHK